VAVPHTHRLTRLETVERDETVRVLADPALSVAGAAATLGMGRATLYRKLRHYGIARPA
jgi:sigma-54 dependent transcriptional regulator, acetoin dehydrogenase operon transcriptional activator AcoR